MSNEPPRIGLAEVKPQSDVAPTIQSFLDKSDDMQSVMLLSINKDGSQFMVTSTMSGMEKAFLTQFAQAAMNEHFKAIYTQGPVS
jgi:hypothetical protein